MAFKLNSETRKLRTPDNSTFKFGRRDVPIRKVDLEGTTLGEANMDGTISLDESVDENSPLGRQVVSHEKSHIEDIESGKAAYNDEWVEWEGTKYPRSNGKIKYNGSWYAEGSNSLPWEKKAVRAENREHYA